MRRILTNAFLSSLRKRGREPEQIAGPGFPPRRTEHRSASARGRAPPRPRHWTRSADPVVVGALHELPPEYRIAVYLADVEGYPYREVAAIMGTPIGTVMSRLHRGRARLRVAWPATPPRPAIPPPPATRTGPPGARPLSWDGRSLDLMTGVVDLPLAQSELGRGRRDRLLTGQPAPLKACDSAGRVVAALGGGPAGRAGHDERDLTEHAVGGPVRASSPRGPRGSPRGSWSVPGRPRPRGRLRTRWPGRPASWRARRGDSKNTIVRRSSLSSANRRARSPALRGGNPSKQNRSLGSPETASAAVTADGPGSTVTRDPGLDRRGDQPVAGIADARHARRR